MKKKNRKSVAPERRKSRKSQPEPDTEVQHSRHSSHHHDHDHTRHSLFPEQHHSGRHSHEDQDGHHLRHNKHSLTHEGHSGGHSHNPEEHHLLHPHLHQSQEHHKRSSNLDDTTHHSHNHPHLQSSEPEEHNSAQNSQPPAKKPNPRDHKKNLKVLNSVESGHHSSKTHLHSGTDDRPSALSSHNNSSSTLSSFKESKGKKKPAPDIIPYPELPHLHLHQAKPDMLHIFLELNKIPKMKQFLESDANILLLEKFMKNLDLAWQVAQDRDLAKLIMADDRVFQKLIANKEWLLKHPDKSRRYSDESILSERITRRQSLARKSRHSSRMSRKSLAVIVPVRNVATIHQRATAEDPQFFINVPTTTEYPFDGCGGELGNYFKIMNSRGSILYHANEEVESSCACTSFSLTVNEPVSKAKAMALMKKQCSLFSRREIAVYCPPTHCIGYVRQKWTSREESTIILIDDEGQKVIEIIVTQDPYSTSRRSTSIIQDISSQLVIGTIVGEFMTHLPEDDGEDLPDYGYEMQFPHELNCNLKILLLTAWILIYKLYFDQKVRKDTEYNKKVKTRKEKDENTTKSNNPSPEENVPDSFSQQTVEETASEFDLAS